MKSSYVKKLILGAALSVCSIGAQAVQIGPNPTTSSLEASAGSFSVGTISVSSLVSGFDGGTIYYPTASGTYGVIAICPGYTASSSSLAWWGRKLASWGFIAFTIDTNSIYDQPYDRAPQLIAALDYVVGLNSSFSSPLRGKVATDRQAVMGHSMGGGGTLIAAEDNVARVDAAFPMTPWSSLEKDFSGIRAPTMVLGCESDSIAPTSSHAIPFYTSMTQNEKMYIEINNADHFCPTTSNPYQSKLGRYGISFMKRFLDGDTRFTPWLCPSASGGNGVVDADRSGLSPFLSDFRSTCAF